MTQSHISIPMPDWFHKLSGEEKLHCLNDLDNGNEIEVETEYSDFGILVRAKYIGSAKRVQP